MGGRLWKSLIAGLIEPSPSRARHVPCLVQQADRSDEERDPGRTHSRDAPLA